MPSIRLDPYFVDQYLMFFFRDGIMARNLIQAIDDWRWVYKSETLFTCLEHIQHRLIELDSSI